MQITETLNSEQRLMSLGHKEALEQTFSIFKELENAGFEVEYFYVRSFGRISIVPSTKRIRVKACDAGIDNPDYCMFLAQNVRKAFECRESNAKYIAGQKYVRRFKHKGKYSV